MIYEGAALHVDFEKGRKHGNIRIKRNELVLKDAEGFEYELPLTGIEITQGGAGNRYIYFKHKRNPDLTIYTDDKNILKCEELKNNENLKKVVRQIQYNRNGLKLAAMAVLVLFLAAIATFYAFRVSIVEYIASLVPPSIEQKVSEQIKSSILAEKKVISSPYIDSQLRSITTPLVNAVESKEFKFSFTIIEDETLNAFALPGGTIMIHSGLIEKAKSAEEVAGVLAHEISHITQRHHMRGIIGKFGMFTIVRGLLGDVAGISSDLIAVGATLESMSYSRDFERESDIIGFELLLRARIHPQGMVSFFETMEKEHGSMEAMSFLSSHPDVKERIEYLKKRMNKTKSAAATEIKMDFEGFQNEVNKIAKSK